MSFRKQHGPNYKPLAWYSALKCPVSHIEHQLALIWMSSGFHSGLSFCSSSDMPWRGLRSSTLRSKCNLLWWWWCPSFGSLSISILVFLQLPSSGNPDQHRRALGLELVSMKIWSRLCIVSGGLLVAGPLYVFSDSAKLYIYQSAMFLWASSVLS